jgi:pimeloyl-ACP methyl ester carboxylesterase
MAMAEDVAGFIDEHELKNTSLIGHSMSVAQCRRGNWTDIWVGEPKQQ